MKLTGNKRQWIFKRVNEYCKILNMPIPLLLLSRKEYEQWKIKEREKILQKNNGIYDTARMRVGRTVRPSLYGVAHKDDNMIFLNVKASRNLSRLDQTIRHELIHFYRTYNHYNPRFIGLMEDLKHKRIRQ